jgi:hypothetical protein
LKQHAARSVPLAAQFDPAHKLAEFAELYLYVEPQSESLTAAVPEPAPSLSPQVACLKQHAARSGSLLAAQFDPAHELAELAEL